MGITGKILRSGRTALCCASLAFTAGAAEASDWELINAAKSALKDLQAESFKFNREYCGMLGRAPDGAIVMTKPKRGGKNSCMPKKFMRGDIKVLASYHTHGAHTHHADAEVPSVADFDADRAESVFGFISTPGGRLWMTDYRSRTMHQICGVGCLPKDPSFKPDLREPVPLQFTRRELAQREGLGGPKAAGYGRHTHSHASHSH